MKRTSAPRVPLNRALSKLGILSRAQATAAILAGRVSVNGHVVRHPTTLVVPADVRVKVDGVRKARQDWRTILFYKPRGVVTTRRDPEGRPTVFDAIGVASDGMVAVGRLDLATSGLLLLTTDTMLSERLTDPASEVPRVYVVTVRGSVGADDVARLTAGMDGLRARAATVRKASARETHLTLELVEGKNREVRRLFAALGHEVTRLKRVRFAGFELGRLAPGEWRDVSRAEVDAALTDGASVPDPHGGSDRSPDGDHLSPDGADGTRRRVIRTRGDE